MDHLDINEILKILPQRYPFLLIDRVIRLDVEKSLTAIKNVSINEHFFVGHFPVKPVMPGVLLIEALAQASGVLAVKTAEHQGKKVSGLYYFAGIDNARFKRPVVPGDQLHLNVEIVKVKSDIWKLKGVGMVDGEIAVTADIMSVRKEN